MKYQTILVLVLIILFLTTILIYWKPKQEQKEGLASVLKECEPDKYHEEERDIFIRWPYIEYEPECKWRRFDSIRY